ncbi:MAG: ABC transporter permease, partial [Bacillota bacterium]
RAHRDLGLDQPLYRQYITYLGSLLSGDWGRSLRTRRPVSEDVRRFLAASLELVIISTAVALAVGIPLGITSAVKKDSWIDHVTRLVAISGVSMPIFWLGLLMQLVFARGLGILPLSGRISSQTLIMYPVTSYTGLYTVDTLLSGNLSTFLEAIRHLVLPALTLGYASLALFARMTRSSMVEVLSQDYIRTVRAMGFSERVIHYRYALKNALIPVLTVAGLSFGYLIAGTFLVEVIFDWPGLGLYVVNAIMAVDYPAVMGVTMISAIAYVLINLAVDLGQGLLDPRTRYD